jgi:hypothetical protein
MDDVLNKYDITVLRELRSYLKKRGILEKWKYNVTFARYRSSSYTFTSLGKNEANMLNLGKIMLQRAPNRLVYGLSNYDRMLKLIGHSLTSFPWDWTVERFDFWRAIINNFESYFRKKYQC